MRRRLLVDSRAVTGQVRQESGDGVPLTLDPVSEHCR
ncbi:MAG: hypothetical protein JWO56_1634, partial [Acidobacteria bacterium]|nr:hypothetical protein [Acidobacteriota bacterium]